MRVLVAEDAKDQRMLLKALLKKQGYEVIDTENGAEALQVLKDNPDIRLVVSDWIMPEMDGPELCRQVRSDAFDRYVYVILLTGHEDKDALIQGLEAGADDFVNKPLNPEVLRVRLKAGARVVELEQRLDERNRQLGENLEQLEADLRLAGQTQMSLLPEAGVMQGVSMEWFFQPSRILGGDMFGYQELDEQHICFYQLDVSGHGIPSALFSFLLHHMLSDTGGSNALIKETISHPPYYRIMPAPELVAALNNRFQASPDHMIYFTIAYGVMNTRTGIVELVQAGHPHPLLIRKATGDVLRTGKGGVPVGMIDDITYEADCIQMQPGDRLLLYSDGLIESTNPAGEQYDVESLEALQKSVAAKELKEARDITEQALHDWCDDDRFDDDMTFLMLEWNPEK